VLEAMVGRRYRYLTGTSCAPGGFDPVVARIAGLAGRRR
jgi:hypothetical protein